MASVHKVKLKDGRLVDFQPSGNGLPILLKDGTTKLLLFNPVDVTTPASDVWIP